MGRTLSREIGAVAASGPLEIADSGVTADDIATLQATVGSAGDLAKLLNNATVWQYDATLARWVHPDTYAVGLTDVFTLPDDSDPASSGWTATGSPLHSQGARVALTSFSAGASTHTVTVGGNDYTATNEATVAAAITALVTAIDAGETITCTDWGAVGAEATARLFVPAGNVVAAGSNTSVVTAPTAGDGFVVGSDASYASAAYYAYTGETGAASGTVAVAVSGWITQGLLGNPIASEYFLQNLMGSGSGYIAVDRDTGGVYRYWTSNNRSGALRNHNPVVGTWDWVEAVYLGVFDADAGGIDSSLHTLYVNGQFVSGRDIGNTLDTSREARAGMITAGLFEPLLHDLKWGYV